LTSQRRGISAERDAEGHERAIASSFGAVVAGMVGSALMLSQRLRGASTLLVAASFVFLLAKCSGRSRAFQPRGSGAGQSGSAEEAGANAAGSENDGGSDSAGAGGTTQEAGAAGAISDAGGEGGEGGEGEGGAGEGGAGDTLAPGPPYPIQLAIGQLHICALISDGHVYCWGGGWLGNGNGDGEFSETPVEVTGISTAIQITAGFLTSCALLADLTVKCWGYDEGGQISGSKTMGFKTPTTVTGLTSINEVLTTGLTSCALLSNGGVRCWGSRDGSGMIPTATKVMALLNDATHLGGKICAILLDKTLQCWEGVDGTPTAQTGLPTNVTQVAGKCALSGDGSVRCWGPGDSGQIGNGQGVDQAIPQQVAPLGKATWIGAGNVHVCALLSDQTLWCWGKDGFQSAIDYGAKPLRVDNIGKVLAAAAGDDNTCVIEADHTVRCWGSNYTHQLGTNYKKDANSPTPIAIAGLPK